MLKRILVILFVTISNQLIAQDNALYLKELFVFQTDTMPYRLLLPQNYNPDKKYPMILFLHGSGEKGGDNVAQLIHGGSLFLRDSIRKNYPAIVVIPQCPLKSNWVDNKRVKDSTGNNMLVLPPDAEPTTAMVVLQKLVKRIKHDYKIDKKRIYVGGLSLGGMGTYDIVKRNPRMFAAAFPVCGAADERIAPKLKHIDWWIFHGAEDNVVLPGFSIKMVAAMQELKIPVRYTSYPQTGHNSWDKTFDEPGLFSWLFSKSKN